jgi:tetratricopeptide (TPR) repeat protein
MTGEGEFVLIKHHLESALHASAAWMGEHDVYATLVDAAAMHCDEAAIRQYAPPAEELAIRHGHRLYQAVIDRAWGVAHRLAGEYNDAAARLNQALEILRGLNARWQIGRTFYELGQLAAVQMDRDAAHAYFSDALAHFEVMHAAPDIAKARAALATLEL